MTKNIQFNKDAGWQQSVQGRPDFFEMLLSGNTAHRILRTSLENFIAPEGDDQQQRSKSQRRWMVNAVKKEFYHPLREIYPSGIPEFHPQNPAHWANATSEEKANEIIQFINQNPPIKDMIQKTVELRKVAKIWTNTPRATRIAEQYIDMIQCHFIRKARSHSKMEPYWQQIWLANQALVNELARLNLTESFEAVRSDLSVSSLSSFLIRHPQILNLIETHFHQLEPALQKWKKIVDTTPSSKASLILLLQEFCDKNKSLLVYAKKNPHDALKNNPNDVLNWFDKKFPTDSALECRALIRSLLESAKTIPDELLDSFKGDVGGSVLSHWVKDWTGRTFPSKMKKRGYYPNLLKLEAALDQVRSALQDHLDQAMPLIHAAKKTGDMRKLTYLGGKSDISWIKKELTHNYFYSQEKTGQLTSFQKLCERRLDQELLKLKDAFKVLLKDILEATPYLQQLASTVYRDTHYTRSQTQLVEEIIIAIGQTISSEQAMYDIALEILEKEKRARGQLHEALIKFRKQLPGYMEVSVNHKKQLNFQHFKVTTAYHGLAGEKIQPRLVSDFDREAIRAAHNVIRDLKQKRPKINASIWNRLASFLLYYLRIGIRKPAPVLVRHKDDASTKSTSAAPAA